MKNNKIKLSNGQGFDWPQEVTIYTDGACRGNPGFASFGLVAMDSKEKIIFEEAQTLGSATNNVAEYKGVHRALQLAVQNNIKHLTIKADSQLAVRQLKGEYKVKNALLKPIYAECLLMINKIPKCHFIHVPREKNKRADELANLALDSSS